MREVLITGAGSGIGEATAHLFSERGWKVYLLGRNLEKLKKVAAQLKGPSFCISYDQSQSTGGDALLAHLNQQKSKLSALINNAAIYAPAPFADESDENWVQHINTNLLGPIRLTRLLLPEIKQNKGCIVNISSTLGLRPIENTGAYSATKAAINSWTQTLALEVAKDGVRVNSICPGLVDTPIHAFHQSNNAQHQEIYKRLQNLQPLGRIGQPDDIAKAAYFVASEDAPWMTGALIPVDGGVNLTTKEV